MSQIIHGVIHGKTIELSLDPGLKDGEPVEVVVRPAVKRLKPGEGILRTAGAIANDPQAIADFEEIFKTRREARFRELPE